MGRPGFLVTGCRGDLMDMALLLTYCAGAGDLGWLSSRRPVAGARRQTPVTAAERYVANALRPLVRSSRPLPTTVGKTTRPRRSITAALLSHHSKLGSSA